MTGEDQNLSARKRRRRPRRVTLLCLVIALLMLWLVVEHFVVAQCRPWVITALQNATGLPVTIGKVRVRLFPHPAIVADGISVGDGDLEVRVARAKASAEWEGLLHREIRIPEVTLSGLSMTVPQDAATLVERLKAIAVAPPNSFGGVCPQPGDSFAATPPNKFGGATGGLPFTFVVGEVSAHGCELYLANSATLTSGRVTAPAGEARIGSRQTSLVTWDLVASNVLGETISIALHAHAPLWNRDAQLDAKLNVMPRAGPAIRGTIAVTGVVLRDAYNHPWMPPGVLDAHVALYAANPNRVQADITGKIAGRLPIMSGAFSATAWWDAGALTVNDFNWQSPGIQVTGDVTRGVDGLLACHLVEANVDRNALAALLTLQPAIGFSVLAQDNAGIHVSDVLAGATPERTLRFVRGDAEFHGIDMKLPDGTEAVAGLHGRIGVDEGTLRLDPLAAEGVSISGALTPDIRTGRIAFDLNGTGELTPARLAILMPSGPLTDIGGTVKFQRISGTFIPGQEIPADLAVQSTLENGHVAVILPTSSEPAIFTNLHGAFEFRDAVIRLTDLAGDGVGLRGAIKLDRPARSATLDLQGTATLDRARLALVMGMKDITDVGGTVDVTRIHATFKPEERTPADLVVEGVLQDGHISVASAGFSDQIAGISGTFAARARDLEAELAGTSVQFGDLRAGGQYLFPHHRFQGTLTCDIERLAAPLLPPSFQQELVASVARAYGTSTFRIALALPAEKNKTLSVSIARVGDPRLEGKIALQVDAGTMKLGNIDVAVNLPLEPFKLVLPVQIKAEGAADLTFQRTAAAESFTARADLSAASVVAGKYLAKRMGDPASVEVTGSASGKTWTLRAAKVTCLGVEAPVLIEGRRVFVDNADLNLGALVRLLPEGATAHGRVRASMSAPPFTASLEFDRAGVVMSPELAFDSVTGDLTYADGRLISRNMRVLGAQSDVTFTTAPGDAAPAAGSDLVQAKVTGGKFDVNALLELIHAIDELKGKKEPRKEAERPKEPSFSFVADVENVFYRRGRAEQVHAEVSINDGVVRIRNLTARPYSGVLIGSVDVVPKRGGSQEYVEFNAAFEGIGARYVDELLFDPPRECSGTLTGKAHFRIPTSGYADPIEGTSGTAEFTGKDGTFGKFGLATQLLTVLRGAELVRLRIPSLKDEGLTFKTCAASFSMTNGVLNLQEANIVSPAFALEAEGTVDFPGKQINIPVRVNMLESVTGIVRYVPLLGMAVSKAAGIASLHLLVEGSPYDAGMRMAPEQRIENATKKAGNAVNFLQNVFEGSGKPRQPARP